MAKEKVRRTIQYPANQKERDDVATSGADTFLYLHALRPWISVTDGFWMLLRINWQRVVYI
jgi:hypothetical protein